MPFKILIKNKDFTLFHISIISCSFDFMKDTYFKNIYKCKCGIVLEEFVWKSKLDKHTFACSKCSGVVGIKNAVVKKAAQSAAIRTPTKNR